MSIYDRLYCICIGAPAINTTKRIKTYLPLLVANEIFHCVCCLKLIADGRPVLPSSQKNALFCWLQFERNLVGGGSLGVADIMCVCVECFQATAMMTRQDAGAGGTHLNRAPHTAPTMRCRHAKHVFGGELLLGASMTMIWV